MPARVDLVTPAGPARASSRTATKRTAAAAFGLVSALLVPLPAGAAPAPCEQAQRYAAQSGSGILRLAKLDLGPAGRQEKPITDVGVGDAKSALVAQSPINSAALARVLDGGPADREDLTDVLQQQAPPSHKKAKSRDIDATEIGPIRLGRGEMTVHAKWDPGMACGAAEGDVTRSEAELNRAGVLEPLVRVPRKVSSVSTTAVEGRGKAARTVASASLTGGDVSVLDGAVKVKVIEPPSLLAGMSLAKGGEVRYLPAVIEVSGKGIKTERLDTAGDNIEVVVDEGTPKSLSGTGEAADDSGDEDTTPGQDSESATAPHDDESPNGAPGANEPADQGDGKVGVLSGLPKMGGLKSASPTPAPGLPAIPDLPLIKETDTEATPAAGPGTRVKVSLGDVRQAASGHAIAAKATAIHIAVTQGSDPQAYGDSGTGVVLDLEMGLLEVAAVSPEPAGGAGVSDVAGSGGGLPITGPRVDVLALSGLALLIAGAAALVFGMRGRPRP
ncbi:hypothetical protein [Actinoplanes friuliensis]|uniref:hypothetical protein n=1 Tax=Actinoplanes friuliensis TaxID=196914 RepID=UPI0011DD314E|nr:hypothetical protein [Actinoplanes friuliensis]